MIAFWNFIYQQRNEILQQTIQHIYLTLIALFLAILIGVIIGVFLTRYKKIANSTLGLLGVVQTIPSLALLGFMLPVLGIGALPAIIALFLYALLPIVRNTYTGIIEVDKTVREAARGMGMSEGQVLTEVELPLALPVIFAGIRTAVVINVGIATLCSLIGAGGLGGFIFSGISLKNSYMTLAGAIPAALLALLLDYGLGVLQHYIQYIIHWVLGISFLLIVGLGVYSFLPSPQVFTAAFDAEFGKRQDGYLSLQKVYGMSFPKIVELDAGLMYDALKEGEVDVISGYTTEGKIDAYNLLVLEDDQNALPSYLVAPVFHEKTLKKYPFLREVFQKIEGKISDERMRKLNLQVDRDKKSPKSVAKSFLQSLKLRTEVVRRGTPDIIIGGKKFTEQYILLELFKLLIENYTPLTVEVKNGMGGTKILFDAVKTGGIDVYPEYTGTAFLVILQPDEQIKNKMMRDRDKMYRYVKEQCLQQHGISWLNPLGFNNAYALMMRKSDAETLHIRSLSELATYLKNMK